jgi:predicted nuclease of predicted toxin-antitoxin system
MKFKIDENLPVEAAELLRGAGHDALTVYDQNLKGEIDRNLRKICASEGRTIVTLDLDFSDVRMYQNTPGCILLRLYLLDRNHVLKVMQRILPLLQQRSVANSLWIVEESRVRIREA